MPWGASMLRIVTIFVLLRYADGSACLQHPAMPSSARGSHARTGPYMNSCQRMAWQATKTLLRCPSLSPCGKASTPVNVSAAQSGSILSSPVEPEWSGAESRNADQLLHDIYERRQSRSDGLPLALCGAIASDLRVRTGTEESQCHYRCSRK